MVLLRRHNSHSLFLFPRLSSPCAVGVSTPHYRADVVAFLRPPKPIIPRLTLPRRDPFVPRRPGVKLDMPTIPIWPACHSVPEYTSKPIFLAFRSPRQFISPFDSTACFSIFLFFIYAGSSTFPCASRNKSRKTCERFKYHIEAIGTRTDLTDDASSYHVLQYSIEALMLIIVIKSQLILLFAILINTSISILVSV